MNITSRGEKTEAKHKYTHERERNSNERTIVLTREIKLNSTNGKIMR